MNPATGQMRTPKKTFSIPSGFRCANPAVAATTAPMSAPRSAWEQLLGSPRREQMVIRLLFYKGLSRPEIEEKMKLRGEDLEQALDSAFAKLREGLRSILAS